jgi:hypothetical protein
MQLAIARADATPLTAIEIQQDPVEPGVDAAAALEAVFLPRQDQEGFLSQVVGIGGVAAEDERCTVDAREVGLTGFMNVDPGHGAPIGRPHLMVSACFYGELRVKAAAFVGQWLPKSRFLIQTNEDAERMSAKPDEARR